MNTPVISQPLNREVAGQVADDYLTNALRLLRRLNQLKAENGKRVTALITADGFEPWWFIQETIFWHLLVPYARDPKRVRDWVMSQRRSDFAQLPITEASPKRSRGGFGVVRNVLRRLATVLMAASSFVALILFRFQRRDTLVYALDKVSPGLDHDFRISAIYRELRARGYRFAEYVHVAQLAEAGANALRRHRPVVWLEPITDTYAWLNFRRIRPLPPVIADSKDSDGAFLAMAADIALAHTRQAAQRYHALKRILRIQHVRRAVILDDSRHANSLIAACRQLGIPTLGYMHGLLNRYHPGLMAYGFNGARPHTFDLYAQWSDYFRRRLFEGSLYGPENTFVCGPLRAPPVVNFENVRERRGDDETIRVLLVSEPRTNFADVAPYVEALHEDRDIEIIVKTRPGETSPPIAKLLGRDRVHWIPGSVPLHEAILQCDVVLGTYSTVLYEAALLLRPAVVLDTPFRYGHDLVRDGLGDFACTPQEVVMVTRRAHATDAAERDRRRNTIWGDALRDGARTLFDVAEQRLWIKPNG
jgi:hypothetical protein